MVTDSERTALFISHATPEDNDFVRWLGAKLTAMGYEVWADVMRLHGGLDWARALEDALRNKAVKVLLVCTPSGLEKQGVRNEIEIAMGLATRLKDQEFLIPLRLAKYEAPFRIAHLQYIDFQAGWASGLIELLSLLEDKRMPSRRRASMQGWLSAQSIGAATLSRKSEPLVSNWLELAKMPSLIHYLVPPTGFSSQHFQKRENHRWPIVAHQAGVLSFATPDGAGQLSDQMPATLIKSINTAIFLMEGDRELGITAQQARNAVVDLGTRAFDSMCATQGLKPFENASGRFSWWPDIKSAPLNQVRFDWNILRGSRQIIGHSDKRRVHWHYAIAGQFRLVPIPHLRLSARLVFSENGMDAITDARKAHSLRRSFAKGWRNARWRDMLCAYVWWLSKRSSEIQLPVAEAAAFVFDLPPMRFGCPVSVNDADDANADEEEDDPDYSAEGDDEFSESDGDPA